jgi:hexulose-6-phosphate isomerase
MKKALTQICMAKERSLKDCLEFTKSAGYDGLELRFSDDGYLKLNSSHDELKSIKKLCQEIGMTPCSAVGGRGGALASPNPQERERAKESLTQLLRCASALGIDAVLVIPGRVSDELSYDVAYHWTIESLKEMAPVAEKYKVAIAIENVWNKFLLSPLEMRDMVDTVGSEYVGVFFDVGNVVIFGYPEQWIKILGGRIKKVHFKDFKRSNYQFVPLMEGDVNWKVVMPELRNIGYDGFVISEVGGGDEVDRATSKAMDKILNL